MKTGTFQKKPIQVEAIQMSDPVDWNQLTEFFGSKSGSGTWQSLGESVNISGDSHRGVLVASPGHWIARDENGEYHVLSNQSFEKLYEEVTDGDQIG